MLLYGVIVPMKLAPPNFITGTITPGCCTHPDVVNIIPQYIPMKLGFIISEHMTCVVTGSSTAERKKACQCIHPGWVGGCHQLGHTIRWLNKRHECCGAAFVLLYGVIVPMKLAPPNCILCGNGDSVGWRG